MKPRYPGLIPFTAAFFVFLLLHQSLTLHLHHDQLVEIATHHAEEELELMGVMAEDAAVHHDYASIERFLEREVSRHEHVALLEATTPDGRLVLRSERQLAESNRMPMTRTVRVADEPLLVLRAVWSLHDVEQRYLASLWLQGGLSVAMILLFALTLWWLLRRTAVEPLKREVEARREAERELILFRRFAENSGQGFGIARLEGTIHYVNPALATLLGATRAAELIDRRAFHHFYAPEELQRLEREILPEVMERGHWQGEIDLTIPGSGRRIPTLENIFLIRDEERGQHFLANLITDISERRRAEQLLQRRIDQEVEKNREKDRLMFHQARYAQMGEMLSMVAHQWRQPLTALNTAGIDLALKHSLGELSDEHLSTFTRYLERQTQRMSATIDDFMDFFRPERQACRYTLAEVAEEIRQLMGAQLDNRGLTLLMELPAEPALRGFRKELEQVLINLIANARDAYVEQAIGPPPPATADDPAEPPGGGTIRLTAERHGEGVRLLVEDRAGGIPEQVIPRIFDPYFTTKEQGKGTGLGLYMSRMLTERSFGGTLRAEHIDGGTRFVIELPLALNSPQAAPL